MRGQPIEWELSFSSKSSDERLISRISKELRRLSPLQTTKDIIKNGQIKEHLSKEVQMANKCMENVYHLYPYIYFPKYIYTYTYICIHIYIHVYTHRYMYVYIYSPKGK